MRPNHSSRISRFSSRVKTAEKQCADHYGNKNLNAAVHEVFASPCGKQNRNLNHLCLCFFLSSCEKFSHTFFLHKNLIYMQKAADFSAALHIEIDCFFGSTFLFLLPLLLFQPLLCLYLLHFFRCPLWDMLIINDPNEIGTIKMCFLTVA